MTKKTSYRFTLGARLFNEVFKGIVNLGLGARFRYILRVRGSTTGIVRSTPVDVMSGDGVRWVVAGYSVTGWVRNVRAAGQATLSRHGRSESVRLVELDAADSVPVLRKYLREVPIVRPYFAARPDSTDDEIAAEVVQHPVFQVLPLTGAAIANENFPSTEPRVVAGSPGGAPNRRG